MTAQQDGTGNGLPAARLREAAGPPGDWTDPGADEAAPGVWRIPLPLPQDGLRAVNVYAITDGSGLVRVDGGWALPESREELARAQMAIIETAAHLDVLTDQGELKSAQGAVTRYFPR
jgi:hypothetical protein